MNLTIHNPSKTAKTQSALYPGTPNSRKSYHDPPVPVAEPQQCAGFFSNCMGGQQRHKEQIHEYQHQTKLRVLDVPSTPSPKRHVQNSQEKPKRKGKISLSLNHKDIHLHTPTKEQHPSNNHRYASQHKKFKTEQGNSQGNLCISSKAEAIKLKTEPKKQKRSDEGIHQLKQSRKPSTQIDSANSAKKSSESSGRVKLTLSNGFRSQMQVSPQALPLPAPQEPPSSVVIEESFMTARLANIYGQRTTELQLFPNSNIVYYNKLMADEKSWRGKGEQRLRVKGEISIQNIPDDDQNDQQQEEPNIKSRFKQRKWIGEYAKTIKTFNQSQLRSNQLNSEAESIVLQKGYSHFYSYGGGNIMSINRGSIKQCKQYVIGEQKREFGSVGEPQGAYSVTHENRFKKMTSPPIAEDLHDSDPNCQRE